MALDTGLVAWVEEAMAPIGVVTWGRMFGGAALYLDGTVFALIVRDALWFVADAETAPVWDAVGAEPFSYARRSGQVVVTRHRRAPDACLDDAEALRHWARLALNAAARR